MVIGLEIGLTIICGGVLGATFYFTKKHLKEYQQLKENDTATLEKLKNSINIEIEKNEELREQYKQHFIDVNNQMYELNRERDALNSRYEKEKHILDNDYKAFIEARAADKELYLKQLREDAATIEEELRQEKEELSETILNLKERIKDANNSLAIAEQEEKKKKYYKIQIAADARDDIALLKDFAPNLKNPSILYKLIWKTYYQKPLNDLIARMMGNTKVSGIYKITNVLDNKAYIGRAVDVGERWKQHVKGMLRADENKMTIPFYNAAFTVGAENFTFEILQTCDINELPRAESYWIDFYDTVTYGYNDKSGSK